MARKKGGARGRGMAPPRPRCTGVHTEDFDMIDRLLPASDRPRHPARLVSDAIGILGCAQERIRGKKRRRAVRKARRTLIDLLDDDAVATSACKAGGSGRNNCNSGSGGGGGRTRRSGR